MGTGAGKNSGHKKARLKRALENVTLGSDMGVGVSGENFTISSIGYADVPKTLFIK
jgi:hypothetical protein